MKTQSLHKLPVWAWLVLILLPTVIYAGLPAAGGTATAGERIACWLNARGLSPQLVVFLIAMLPIVELRGAVPAGNNLFHLPLSETLLLSILGNMVPIVLVLLLLEKMVKWLGNFSACRRFFDWLFVRTRKRSGVIQRFEFWGLVIFVGIPLPMTGAWTGSIAAVLLGLSYWRALFGIFLGVLLAAVIVTSLALLKWWGALIAGVVLTGLLIQQALAAKKRRPGVNR
jgi:uncharacterized membrane protein